MSRFHAPSLSRKRSGGHWSKLRFETLESRRLLAVTSSFAEGTLQVSGDENITITAQGGLALINGATPPSGQLSAGSIEHVVVVGGSGTQRIDLDAVDASAFTAMVDTVLSFSVSSGAPRTVLGSQFRDVIIGTDENDTLWGGGGDDSIYGGGGDDELKGGEGDDHLEGGTANNPSAFASTAGLDSDTLVLTAGGGNDTLDGGGGADTITAGTGTNAISADNLDTIHWNDGAGAVVLTGNDIALVVTLGGASHTATIDSSNVVIDNSTIFYGASSSLASIDVRASGGDDGFTVALPASGNLPVLNLDPGLGTNSLTVDATASTTSHNVSIDGGQVTVDGTAITYSALDNITVNSNSGGDTFTVTHPDSGSLPANVSINGRWFTANSLFVNGSSGNDTMTRSGGQATVNGTTIAFTAISNLEIAGGDGDDTITVSGGGPPTGVSGGAGNDTITVAASGSATLRGDSGQNTYVIGESFSISNRVYVIDQSAGQSDTLSFAGWNGGVTVDLSLDAEQAIQFDSPYFESIKIKLIGASDTITTVVGTSADDDIKANDLGNFLQGGAGDDTLTGGAGDDILEGGAGDDALTGGLGDDALDGGAGLDTLTGGDGNDTYFAQLGEGLPQAEDTMFDSPASSGLYRLTTGVTVDHPETFELAVPPGSDLKYDFALASADLATSYEAANTNNSGTLTFTDPATQAVWGRVFAPDGTYNTYRAEVNVKEGYRIDGLARPAATSPFELTLLATDNLSPGVLTDWLIDWDDGSPVELFQNVIPTRSDPVRVTHMFPDQTGLRQIKATVTSPTGSLDVDPITVAVVGDQPFEPDIISAVHGGNVDLTITWQPAPGPEPTQYTIYASENGVDGWTVWVPPIFAPATTATMPVFEKTFFKMTAANPSGVSLDSRVAAASFIPEDVVVPVTAHVQTSPLAIVLDWPLDIEATQYTVYRRTAGSTDWGTAIGTLPGDSTGFVDDDPSVVSGAAFEYKVDQDQVIEGTAWVATGFVEAGIEVPLVEDRGTTLLVVDDTFAVSLAGEIARLQQDLIGDGWKVIRHDVARTDSVEDVKSLIQMEYDAAPDEVQQVLLLGHVAVPYSGNVAPDKHLSEHLGAWPADVYYGDIDGIWTDELDHVTNGQSWQSNVAGDGKFDQDNLSEGRVPELAVGRIDMSGMTASDPLGLGEEGLLRRYLDRDHAFRHGEFDVQQRAFIDNELGPTSPAALGFGNFSTLVGPSNVEFGDFFTEAAQPEGYLWGYGGGLGLFHRATGVGTTSDFMATESNVVFTILFGSFFGDWNVEDNFLRAPLAGQGYGLTSSWGHFRGAASYYRMGLGGTVGESLAYSESGGPDLSPSDVGVWAALMGDPSLRMHVVKPPSNVSATPNGTNIEVTWTASPDSAAAGFQGYVVYRGTSTGALTKIKDLEPNTSFIDTTAESGPYVYMVRAVKLETGFSGTYYNASQGAFAFSSSVTGRHIFYNQSAYDGRTSGIDPSDSSAIATDKSAYLPAGGVITAASMSNYSRGINGIMVDLTGGHGTLSLADFKFALSEQGASANNTPSTWVAAPAPTAFTVLADTPVVGTDRVEFIWTNNAIENRYLQVIFEGNDTLGGFNTNTGLAASDIFYFGNQIGDDFLGTPASIFSTSAADEIDTRSHPGFLQPLNNIFDYNKDSLVSAFDQIIARSNVGTLSVINITSPPAGTEAGFSSATGDGSGSAVASALTKHDLPSRLDSSSLIAARPSGIDPRSGSASIARVGQVVTERDAIRAQALSKVVDEVVDGLDFDDDLLDPLVTRLLP